MKIHLSIIFLLFSTLVFSQETGNQPWLNSFINDSEIANSPMSICAIDVETGNVILDINDNLSIPTASTLKLITTATALQILGNDFRFKTKLHYSGEIIDSILHGSIIIEGGGDPTLGSKYMFGSDYNSFYKKWVQAVKSLGIKEIDGDILIDASYYTDEDVPRTWIWEDLGNHYGAAAQSFALYDNTCKIVFETEAVTGGTTTVIGTEPFIPDFTIKNEVIAADDNRDRAYVFGSPFESYRIIRGTLPKGRSEFKIKASIPDPGLLLAFDFQKALQISGIEISGNYHEIDSDINTKHQLDSTFYVWSSPTLSEIIQPLNYESINLFAEHLCKQIGLAKYGEGSTSNGTKAIKNYWNNKGFDTDFLFLADGSGLSRANAVSAKFMTDVLNYMYHDSAHSEAYKNSIPYTGMQGTQQYYFQDSFLKGKAQAKSGSMTRIRSFAGYMRTQNGNTIAFSIIVNNFNCSSFQMAHKMERLMEKMYLEL